MQFFIPAAKDKAKEEQVYSGITRSLSEQGHKFDGRRVFKLRYTHDGKEYCAEVGRQHPLNGEPVVAILHEPIRCLYHVCTTNRGVARGGSILVGEGDVLSVEDFESE